MAIVGALPYTLTNNTTADANQVQSNLQYIADQVNANVSTAIAAAILAVLPIGTVALWSGSVASIPSPWQLCDGTNGAPDLRDKFLVGAGNTYAVGATGGATGNTPTITVAGHVLTLAEIPSHNHSATDSGHGHGATDSGHGHGISDPTHVHNAATVVIPYNGINQDVRNGTGGISGSYGGVSTDAQSTGVTVNTGNANVTIGTGTANVTIGANGGGGAHVHTASSTAVPTLPPYYALAYIRKMS